MEKSDFAGMVEGQHNYALVLHNTDDDDGRDYLDFDCRQTHKTCSTKSRSEKMCGNTSKRRREIANPSESEVKNMLMEESRASHELKKRKRKHKKMKEGNITLWDSHPQEPLEAPSKIRKENNGVINDVDFGKMGKEEDKKTGQRTWSESDELLLVKGFGEYNSLHPDNETSFYSYIKDAFPFNFSMDQLTNKLWKLKNKYEEIEAGRKKDANNSFVDSHQQKLFEASSKIWGRNSSWMRSEAKYFYHSLLSNFMADKGLDFAALDGATRCIFVEEWNNLMLARTYYLTLKAKFDKKVCKCMHNVYKACIDSSPTQKDS